MSDKPEVQYPFKGKRVELVPQPGGWQLLNPGEYGRWRDGSWYGCAPDGSDCNLTNHQVIEHEDGTITVSPSILITSPGSESWHGYLERGIWRLA
jgi:hypothetical protein